MKHRIILGLGIIALTVALSLAAFQSPALAEQADEASEQLGAPLPEVHLTLRNYFLYKNDYDFDRTDPLYKEYGQSVGVVATTFIPSLTWRLLPNVTMQYTVEIGENLWGRNDLDQRDPNAENIPVVRHKEIWAEVTCPKGLVGIRTGYQHVYDPTRLFVDRYMGAGDLFARWRSGQITLGAGLMPEHTYEGLGQSQSSNTEQQNNFENDDALFYVNVEQRFSDNFQLLPAVFVRYDKSIINRPVVTVNPSVRFALGQSSRVQANIDIAGQWGRFNRGGVGERDEDRMAGAFQFSLFADLEPLDLGLNLLALSADDGDQYDNWTTAYNYSGVSSARTFLLSENRFYDQYDNLDEKVAAQQAGLLLIDPEIGYSPITGLRLFTVVGYEMVLETTPTDGESMVGLETDLGVEFALIEDHVTLTILGGGLFPGKAGSMIVNEIDKEATDAIYHVQSAMEFMF